MPFITIRRFLAAILLPASLTAAPETANPGFESELTGWTSANVSVKAGGAFEGSKHLDLQNGYIQQTVTGLTAGAVHSVRLAYKSQSGTGTLADARIRIDGAVIGEIHNGQTNEYLSANGFEFTPAGTNAVLRLESLETGTAGLLVDFVRVVSGGMPSPPETAWADLAVINDSRGGRALKNGGFEQAIGDHTTDPDNSGPTGNEHLSGNSLPGWRVTRENVDVIRFNNANPPEGAN